MGGVDNADVPLHDGDVLTVRQIAGFSDLGSSITVRGEVQHPGGYGIREGERLSSILLRAGGLRASAYPYGAILEREQVRQIEERNHEDLLQRLQAEGNELRAAPDGDTDQKLAKQAAMMQWQTALQRLQSTPPPGRLVVHIASDIKKWANTPADIEVRAGDILTIPKRPNFVMVDGSVYNPTAVSFRPGKSAAWYLRQAGGPTAMANKKAIFVIRADGSVAGQSGGLFGGDGLKAEMLPGDMVVVPEKAYGASTKWKSTLQASQLVYAVGVAVQVARSF
jgi:protein involved in polysaccharide export with SLBB domain